MDSGLKSVSNSLSNFGVLFLAGGLVVTLAIGVVGCFLVLLLLLIDSCVSVVKSNTGVLLNQIQVCCLWFLVLVPV
jgi:hypothetical protein